MLLLFEPGFQSRDPQNWPTAPLTTDSPAVTTCSLTGSHLHRWAKAWPEAWGYVHKQIICCDQAAAQEEPQLDAPVSQRGRGGGGGCRAETLNEHTVSTVIRLYRRQRTTIISQLCHCCSAFSLQTTSKKKHRRKRRRRRRIKQGLISWFSILLHALVLSLRERRVFQNIQWTQRKGQKCLIQKRSGHSLNSKDESVWLQTEFS